MKTRLNEWKEAELEEEAEDALDIIKELETLEWLRERALSARGRMG